MTFQADQRPQDTAMVVPNVAEVDEFDVADYAKQILHGFLDNTRSVLAVPIGAKDFWPPCNSKKNLAPAVGYWRGAIYKRF